MAASLILSTGCFAQAVSAHAGVTAGCNLDSFNNVPANFQCGWHAGATVLLNLPAYFSLQPSVRYNQANTIVELGSLTQANMRQRQLTVPLALQWGPDLGVFRLFVQAVPYVNVNLVTDYQNPYNAYEWTDVSNYVNTAQFGLGAGAGINIWRFQFSFRYNWDLTPWANRVDASFPFANDTGMGRGMNFSLSFFFN